MLLVGQNLKISNISLLETIRRKNILPILVDATIHAPANVSIYDFILQYNIYFLFISHIIFE